MEEKKTGHSDRSLNFIEEIIEEDIRQNGPRVQTRFPPEPNGYLHIGHAKAICINFGVAEGYGGECNLLFDDTNPAKEDAEYVDAIQEDIRWLGFAWQRVYFSSSYFGECYELAVKLIKKSLAYVDDLTKDEMRQYRGTLTEPGRDSPFRTRSVTENLDLFSRMRAGEFPDGAKTLRAKINMASPNINLRDPALYRILHMPHHQTGNAWCIYPMYDFAHPIQDAIEGVTHSLCSMEYEAHRPLYDWVTEHCGFNQRPRQIEFARLHLANTIMSKRHLRRLVEEGRVSGWDDPRMPTLCAMRRRGYTPAAIRDFLERVGVAKADSVVDPAMLEHCVREDLNESTQRRVAVLRPLPLVIENWPDDTTEAIALENHPNDPLLGTRTLHMGRELYIERMDFAIDPPGKFFRLKPGGEVRLKGAYIVRCESFDTDDNGEVCRVHARYDPASKSGTEARKVKGTLHWLSVRDAVPATFRLYEPLLLEKAGDDEAGDFAARLNPASLTTLDGFVEPALRDCAPGESFQFLRQGYFCTDPDGAPGRPVFNRTVSLKDGYKG